MTLITLVECLLEVEPVEESEAEVEDLAEAEAEAEDPAEAEVVLHFMVSL